MRPWTVQTDWGVEVRCERFNGATALRPWTAECDGPAADYKVGLQWGHGLAAVDGALAATTPAEARELQWGHGLAAVDGGADRAWRHLPLRASMGPRPCGRGRLKAIAKMLEEAGLQWGHGLAAVDGEP